MEKEFSSGSSECSESVPLDEPACAVLRLIECPVCNNPCMETTTINRCLHRFCKDCIYQKVQDGLKQCPVCEEDLSYLSPNQYLRADENFQRLIDGVLILVEAVRNGLNKRPIVQKGEVTTTTSKKKRNRSGQSQFPSGKGKANEGSSNEGLNDHKKEEPPIWIRFVPHNNEKGHGNPDLAEWYICLKDYDHPASLIYKYLAQKLKLQTEDEVEVLCNGEAVKKDMPILDVAESWWAVVGGDLSIRLLSGQANDVKAKELALNLVYRRKNAPVPRHD